jgi:hypothetical protein
MSEDPQADSLYGVIALLSFLATAIVLSNALVLNPKWYWLLWITVPMLIIALLRLHRKRQ